MTSHASSRDHGTPSVLAIGRALHCDAKCCEAGAGWVLPTGRFRGIVCLGFKRPLRRHPLASPCCPDSECLLPECRRVAAFAGHGRTQGKWALKPTHFRGPEEGSPVARHAGPCTTSARPLVSRESPPPFSRCSRLRHRPTAIRETLRRESRRLPLDSGFPGHPAGLEYRHRP